MMLLEEIEEKLKEIDSNVFYGKVLENSVEDLQLWNYIVFNRSEKRVSENKTGYTDYFMVHLVRENFIPEGEEENLIEKVCEIAGVRVEGEGQYNYSQRPNTNAVCEIFSIEFYKAKKKKV